MPPRKTAVRTVDGKGRVTLPAAFADATVLIEQTDANTVVIRRAVVTPVPPPEIIVRMSDADAAAFEEAIENPPRSNRALRRLMGKKPKEQS
jgi:uncharacterized protein (DUF1778 family)